LYGNGAETAARTLTVVAIEWMENFDLYPLTELLTGNPLTTPDLSISVVVQDGIVVIMPSSDFIRSCKPGKFAGMMLAITSAEGGITRVRFELKKKCTRISFWHYSFATVSSRASISIYDSNKKLLKQDSFPDLYQVSSPEQYDFASSDIASFEIQTTNLIGVDHFVFWG
jgi:hypothetical protein